MIVKDVSQLAGKIASIFQYKRDDKVAYIREQLNVINKVASPILKTVYVRGQRLYFVFHPIIFRFLPLTHKRLRAKGFTADKQFLDLGHVVVSFGYCLEDTMSSKDYKHFRFPHKDDTPNSTICWGCATPTISNSLRTFNLVNLVFVLYTYFQSFSPRSSFNTNGFYFFSHATKQFKGGLKRWKARIASGETRTMWKKLEPLRKALVFHS